jgi:hypothetical protein
MVAEPTNRILIVISKTVRWRNPHIAKCAMCGPPAIASRDFSPPESARIFFSVSSPENWNAPGGGPDFSLAGTNNKRVPALSDVGAIKSPGHAGSVIL